MTNITDEMAEAGAKVLDAVPCLDAADFRQVVRDVYAAMREAEGDEKPEWLNDAKRRGEAIQEEAGRTARTTLRCPPASEFAKQVWRDFMAGRNLTATSDGRW